MLKTRHRESILIAACIEAKQPFVIDNTNPTPKERETLTVEELALSNAYQLEAMINVLERKGLLNKDEVLAELEIIAATKGKKVN